MPSQHQNVQLFLQQHVVLTGRPIPLEFKLVDCSQGKYLPESLLCSTGRSVHGWLHRFTNSTWSVCLGYWFYHNNNNQRRYNPLSHNNWWAINMNIIFFFFSFFLSWAYLPLTQLRHQPMPFMSGQRLYKFHKLLAFIHNQS